MNTKSYIRTNRLSIIFTVTISFLVIFASLVFLIKNCNDNSNEENDVFSDVINVFVQYCNDECVGETSVGYIENTDNGYFARIGVGGVITAEDAYENVLTMCTYFREHTNESQLKENSIIAVSMNNIGCPHDELLIITFYISLPHGVITEVDMQTNSIPYDDKYYDMLSNVQSVGIWSHVDLTDEEVRQLELVYPNAEIIVH